LKNYKKKIKFIEEVYSKYEKNYNLQISLINNLIDSYIFEKKLNNYNFEIIQNLKNIEKIRLSFPDFSLCKSIFEKTETFISFYKKDELKIVGKRNICKKQKIKNSFSKDNFQKNKFQILESKILNKLAEHKSDVNHIILLEDGRIASSSNDNTILIYNKDNNKIELKIENEDTIFYIIQAVNGYIIASETTGSILIYKLTSLTSFELIQKIKAHNGYVRKTIEIEDRRLISCSDDKSIKIWKFIDNQYILENTLNQYNKSEINSVIEINNDIIVSTPWGIGSVVFWNIKELKIVSEIEKIECMWCWNILKKISNDFFLVGGKKYIYLFSIINYNLINKFEIDSICYSVCCLLDGSILTGHQNGNIKQYNLINNELKLIGEKNYHSKEIRVITQLKNNLILSGSSDNTINVYKIE
jgi:WD40 repeat protein